MTTLIYLDQFVYSNIAKCEIGNEKGKCDYWFELYELLKEKVEAEKIICPYSQFHIEETLLLKDEKLYEKHKELWFELSKGYFFVDFMDTKKNYLWFYTREWLKDKKFNSEEDLINKFREKNKEQYLRQFPFIKNNHVNNEKVYEERQYFSELNSFLLKKWQKENEISFDKMYKDEVNSFIYIIILYSLNIPYLKRFFEFFGLYFTNLIEYKKIIVSALSYNRKASIDKIKKDFIQFLSFENFEKIPFIKIGCLLNAAKARKIAHGSKKLTPSFENDVDIVAVHLPLVDAIFLDDEIRGYLKENPIKQKTSVYGTKIFSMRYKEEFMKYIKEIK